MTTSYSRRNHIFWPILLLVLFLAAPSFADETAQTRNPAWAKPLHLPDSENFFEVTPGVLYRSAQPTRKAFRQYEAMGIRTVINLRSSDKDTRRAKRTSLTLHHIPINTWNIDDDHVVQVLTLIRDSEKPVLVHCLHGADRTGLMMAMYRIVEQGWTKEAALDELRNGGYGYHPIWKNIPEYIREAYVDGLRARIAKTETPGGRP